VEDFVLLATAAAAPITVRQRIRAMWASASCVAGALLLVLLLGGWGAYQDWQRIKLAITQAEVTQVRSHAERTAGQIESQLMDMGKTSNLREASQAAWLRARWKRVFPLPNRLYSAVVDSSGRVLAHSDSQREGETLSPQWQAAELVGLGPDVFETDSAALTGGPQAVDVAVPIQFNGQAIGTYHSGLNWQWLQDRIAEGRWRSLQRWAIVVGGILTVVLASSVLLYRITRRAAALENALAMAHARRVGELSQLIVGLAHEIRNPLNAVRLNLFTADRVFRGDASLEADEVAVMLGESVREIERVDELITLLLGYARPNPAKLENVDVQQELCAVLQFLKPSLQGNGIEVDLQHSEDALSVLATRGHIRQILLNLLANARDAVDRKCGKISLSLEKHGGLVELAITDNGLGIKPANRERVFQPFFTTKEGGTGMGLAVVRSLVEAAGGTIGYEDIAGGGCRFVVRWPQAKRELSSKESSAA
jgi:two-component system, NtrC family, sensor histidine kinase HydH